MENKKAALVTGAAKRLGREIVLYLADRGFDIGVHYLGSHDMAAELVEMVKAKGRQCVMVKADLSDPEQIGGLVQNVASQLPHLSLLVNNASIFNGVSFLDTSTKLFDDNFNVHVKTPFFLTQEFAKVCGRGQVVNIVDMAVNFNSTGYFAYLLSKKSLHSFTEMAALALGPNIRVNSIAPGSTLQPVDEEESSYMEERAKQIPLQMQGGPQYITTALGYLLDNAFVTGDCLYVDGGAHL